MNRTLQRSFRYSYPLVIVSILIVLIFGFTIPRLTAASSGSFIPIVVTDQTPTTPLSNPTPASNEPRYISGFGSDNSFTIFFEDRSASNTLYHVSTTTGPAGFPAGATATNIADTHFVVKDWPITIGSTTYAYRGWGSVGNDTSHHFYVSNDMSTWTLVSTFTIPNAVSFTNKHGFVYYGFHDVILLNGTYYAFAESNQSQTMIVRSANGDDVWEAFASVGGSPGDGPLELPSGVAAGWTPSGSFVDLGHDRGYGKVYVDPRDSNFYLAINTAAQPSLPPASLEAAFINPANWTWHDGSTGPAAAPILSETSEHDLRESWVVPNSDPDADWVIVYDADFGLTDGGKALGYATLTPPIPVVYVDDDYDSPGCTADGHTWQVDCFDVIQDGINAVQIGGTVYVAAGTYPESLTINKALTLNGAQSGNSVSGRTAGSAGESVIDVQGKSKGVLITASSVTVDGFDILGDASTYAGVHVYATVGSGSLSSIDVQNNFIHGMALPNPSSAYYVTSYGVWSLGDDVSGTRNTVTGLTVQGNKIYDLGGAVSGSDVSAGAGVWLYSLNDGGGGAGGGALVTGNVFDNIQDGYDSVNSDVEPGVGVAVIDDSDPVPDSGASVTGNQYSNTFGGVTLYATNTSMDEQGSDFSNVTLLALNAGNLASVNETNLSPYARTDKLTGYPSSTAYFASIKDAVDYSDGGAAITATAGTFTEGLQIVIDKDITIVGAGKTSTIIKPTGNTGSDGDSRGWFLVASGYTFNLSEVTLDGTGYKIYQGIRHRGDGLINNVKFTDIKYETYGGVALAAFGGGPVDVTNSDFLAIGRVGVLYWVDGTFSGNTYTGKGVGDWLDYAVDMNAGANVTITNNTVSGNRGVASTDGSTSAGFLVTTYYGSGTAAAITGNTLTDNTAGIAVGYDASDTSTVVAHQNCIYGNDWGIESTAPLVDAENNWWGSTTGPTHSSNPLGTGDAVSDYVDFVPWLDACGGSTTGNFWNVTADQYYATMQEAVDDASSGDVIVPIATGPFGSEGSALVTTSGVTIKLEGRTFGPGSPAFTINADDVTIQGPGVIDGDPSDSGTNSTSPGILVMSSADNFALRDVEVKRWEDGVELAGNVVSFKMFGNWFHDNTGAGIQVNTGVELSGVVTIEGNLFKDNGGSGIQNDGLGMNIGGSYYPLDAEYNSWGDIDGPTDTGDGGDGVSSNVDYTPWTFVEVYLDVDPPLDATVNYVDELQPFNVDLKVDSWKLYGLVFKFTYDPTMLLLNSTTFASPWNGKCILLPGLPVGTVAYRCTLEHPQSEYDTPPESGTIATFNFTATGSGMSGNGPWTTYFDISHLEADTSAAAKGGIKIFVNNAGYGAPSEPDRDITDTNDGQIDITGIAQYTGFIDLQGRLNDSGGLLTVYDEAAKTSANAHADGTSSSGGGYTTAYISPFLLNVGTTYYLSVDRDLYLPTTAVASTTYIHSHALDTRPLTYLNLVFLLGGDATNDDLIDILDAGCIGNRFGMTPASCGSGGSSDVNGDTIMDILDLSLMGGNYTLTYSSWTP